MTDSTPLHDALVRPPPGIMIVGVAVGSAPRRIGEPASGSSERSGGEHSQPDGISAAARKNRGSGRTTARPAILSRDPETRALPTRRGTAQSREGVLQRFIDTDDAALFREALRDHRRANGDSRIEPTEGAGMADRAAPNARRENRAGRLAARRWEIRRLGRDGAGSGLMRSAIRRAHPANSGIHGPVGCERFAPGLPNELMATGSHRVFAGERFDPSLVARLADGIATNSRRFDIHRRSDES